MPLTINNTATVEEILSMEAQPEQEEFLSSLTADSPMGLGRYGARVAKTPMRTLPPRRGGRTVGLQPSLRFSLNIQSSHRWEKPSSPRTDSGFRNCGSNTSRARAPGTSPLWRGTPNFSG